MKDLLNQIKALNTLKSRKAFIRANRNSLYAANNFEFNMAVCSMLNTGRRDRFDAALQRAVTAL